MIRLYLNHQVVSRNKLDSMHWAQRGKHAKMLKDLVRLELCRLQWPAGFTATGKRLVTIMGYRGRKLDADNFVGGCKALVDALTRHRLIVDDSSKWVRVEYHQKKLSESPLGRPLTVVTVEDMP
jgi:Holliday junction resolvase RusA-like endonuclease